MTSPSPEVSEELPLTVVEASRLRLVFAPTRGGRLLSLRVDGLELLWQNPALLTSELTPAVPVSEWPKGDGPMSTWANVGGSKTWPAPQGWSGPGEWAGPPDRVLDSGAYEVTVSSAEPNGAVAVELTSGDDPRSGLRILRRFVVPSDGLAFSQETTFTNVSDRAERWSVWEVCQVDTARGVGHGVYEAGVVVPLGSGRALDLGTWFGGVEAATSEGVVRLPVGTAVAKRGFADVPGIVSYRGPDGSGLSMCQTRVPGAEYPDGGAQIEVWLQTPTHAPISELGGLHPSADLVELELLGPLVRLQPGESTSTRIRWTALPALALE